MQNEIPGERKMKRILQAGEDKFRFWEKVEKSARK